MAKKRRLSDLIGEETQQTEKIKNNPETTEAQESVTNKISDSVSTKIPKSATNKVSELQNNRVIDSESNKVSELQNNRVTDSESNKVSELQNNRVASSKSSEILNQQTNELSNSKTNEVPKYLTLVRKESRLREDQLDSLTRLTRSLNRQRKGSGERITENTLIRIAVDLLMNQSKKLQGITEQELLASIGLE